MPSTPSPTPLRVLVIDDNEASAKTLGWMMELWGHEVRLAHDGAAAIDIGKEFSPQVVLLDIGLPGMNGFEVCERMRQEPNTKDAMFIAQTGWGQQEYRDRSKLAGFDYHLVKPVQMHELEGLVQKAAAQNIPNVA